MSIKIKDDNNFNNLLKNLQSKNLYVGVFGENDSTLFKKAIYNEFGAPKANIRERSFIRSTFDDNLSKVEKTFYKQMKVFLKSGGSFSLNNIYNPLGLLLQGKIKKKIRDLRTPPNLPSTVAQKGSSNPLIDTGQMMRRIDYKVRNR